MNSTKTPNHALQRTRHRVAVAIDASRGPGRRHKGLRRFFEAGVKSGVQPKHAGRLRLQLSVLDTAQRIEDMDIPGYRLHPLKGKLKGRWSIWVSGNWRLTFEFKVGNVHILDYEDYH